MSFPRPLAALALSVLVLVSSPACRGAAVPDTDWAHYGGRPALDRFSPLLQITRENVSRLKVAWTYDTGDAFPESEMQCQPVVARGVLYATSPKLRVFALDAATGKPLWTFDPSEGPVDKPTRTRIRGLMYRERGEDRRVYFAARHWLYALDARTGRPLASFGRDGRIDLREGFAGRDPRTLTVGLNTPGVFFEDLLILGSIVPEGLPSAPGDIRAFDVDTGRLRWSFHTIPHPGEPGHETWPADAWTYAGGANAWSGVSLDERRGLVYAATGSTSYDFYGANRAGDNLYANSVLCLRAATGERVWHFQAVKHDVWDRDFPQPPALVTIRKDGRPRDVVALGGKNGRLYVFDRETGEPVFPMEEVDAPPSDVPGEQTAAKQRLPSLPPPFTRQRFTEDLVTNRSPEAARAVKAKWDTLRKGGEFDPPSLQGTVLFPGMDGGAEWGGVAYDASSGLLYVNANEMAWIVRPRAAGDAEREADHRPRPVRAALRGVPRQGPRGEPAGVPVARRHRVPTQRGRGGGRRPRRPRPHAGQRPPVGPRAAGHRALRRRRHVPGGERGRPDAVRPALHARRLRALH